jgi:hypothetical protein
MPDINVKNYLDQLQPVPTGPLKALHAANDYKGMVQLIKKAMNIADVTFLVFWVTEGAAQRDGNKIAPAWILLPKLPDRLPFYGTKEFKETSLKIYFRKSFLKRQRYDQVAIMIAHELSHVVLDSIRHPLFREEKAVDLTAMLLGFRKLYLSGAHTETSQLGYLSEAEVRLANNLLETSHSDSKGPPSVSGYVRLKAAFSSNIMRALATACVVASIATWLAVTKPELPGLARVQTVVPHPSLNAPIEGKQSGAMKATLPQDLLDRFIVDGLIKSGAR